MRPLLPNLLLFLLTVLSTLLIGGLIYSISILSILLAHEMGQSGKPPVRSILLVALLYTLSPPPLRYPWGHHKDQGAYPTSNGPV